ncbi:hypothetical protein GCM10007063_05420 [Lentibacillus kapialis]|uniref:Uncharacterized protein n=1 Tax=Lentibacillus kapialis TaxID=340214 RepID=A0A917PPD4_9BACI|nr:hypothetical protein [Lentibacillus kapialis]GGJ85879.1 hypothetical protein GCM10007063_05420 [Lentibacillus kapialis]
MIKVGKQYKISEDKQEFAPQFHDILGEKVIVTGEKEYGKYPIKFVDNPNLYEIAQRVRGDLLE